MIIHCVMFGVFQSDLHDRIALLNREKFSLEYNQSVHILFVLTSMMAFWNSHLSLRTIWHWTKRNYQNFQFWWNSGMFSPVLLYTPKIMKSQWSNFMTITAIIQDDLIFRICSEMKGLLLYTYLTSTYKINFKQYSNIIKLLNMPII